MSTDDGMVVSCRLERRAGPECPRTIPLTSSSLGHDRNEDQQDPDHCDARRNSTAGQVAYPQPLVSHAADEVTRKSTPGQASLSTVYADVSQLVSPQVP